MNYESAEYRFERNGNFFKVYKLDASNAYVFQCQVPLQGSCYKSLKRSYEAHVNYNQTILNDLDFY
jgi:hypothetical protein